MKPRTCKRGHIVEGDNAKKRPSTKYVACRQCERDSQAKRIRRRREAEGLKPLTRTRVRHIKSLRENTHERQST